MSTDAPAVMDFEITDETMEAIVNPDDPTRVINVAEKKSRLIPIAQIAPVKKDKWSTFNKKSAREIADSIRVKGLMHPILLRPLAKSPTEVTSDGTMYEVVAGRQRLYACNDILKWNEIPAVVMAMDDSDAEMFCLIENCARKTLKPDQLFAHVAAWRKLHAAKVGAPDPLDLRKGRKEAAAKAREAKKKPKDESVVGLTETGPEAPVAPVANFQEAIAHATGTSVSTAKRTIKVATMLDGLSETEHTIVFPDDQEKHPTNEQLMEMTYLTGDSLRDVLKFRASEMPWDEAISHGKKKPGRRPNPEKPASIDDMSDDEWLEATCSDRMDKGDSRGILSQLKKKSNFKSDAILYRKFVKLRKKIQVDVEQLLISTKLLGHRGPFHLMLERAFRVSFPGEWLLCGMCGGSGKAKINGDEGEMPSCNACNGAGYRVKVEAL